MGKKKDILNKPQTVVSNLTFMQKAVKSKGSSSVHRRIPSPLFSFDPINTQILNPYQMLSSLRRQNKLQKAWSLKANVTGFNSRFIVSEQMKKKLKFNGKDSTNKYEDFTNNTQSAGLQPLPSVYALPALTHTPQLPFIMTKERSILKGQNEATDINLNEFRKQSEVEQI
ncbi:hypothetical protein MJT46_004207 [Ovis ammon polii x Ovis aries]|nr:hypothetical protein MJT46_004207 [Ovis ammon polii x Ovis aries]